MTFMDLDTYEIWAESNIDGFHKGHVKLDEDIAPIIRELNLKGYKTKGSCSGHPYYSLNEAFLRSNESARKLSGFIEAENTGQGEYPIKTLFVATDDELYISFDGVNKDDFPVPLPTGFRWDDDNTIRYDYNETGTYELIAERLNVCKTLYVWARTLSCKN